VLRILALLHPEAHIHDQPSEPQPSELLSPGPVTETAMGLGPDATDAGVLVTDDDADAGAGVDVPAWRPSPRLVAGVVAGLVAVVALVVLVGPSGPPTAALGNIAFGGLPDAPTAPVRQRWTLDLGSRDRLALVDDRVVVVADDPDVDDPTLRVTARHVRSNQVLWERELVGPASVVLVDRRGNVTVPATPPTDDGFNDDAPRLVGVDVEDGGLLWERPAGFVRPQSFNGHLLVQGGIGCTMVEARTGVAAWDTPSGRCEWLDEDSAAVEERDGWEVRSVEGTVEATLPPTADSIAPVAIGDLLVVLERERVVAFDRAGQEQWSVPMAQRDSWITGVGDVVVATTYGGQEPETRAWNLQGEPVELAVDGIEDALALEVDGRTVAVVLDFRRDDDVAMTVHSLDEPATVLGSMTGAWVDGLVGPLTSRGLLVVDPDDGEIGLHSWPDLDPVWTTTMEESTWIDDGWTTMQTSSVGIVLAPWHQGDGRWTIHAHA